MCILGGQLSVFLGLYGSDRFPYDEIRPIEDRNSVKEIPYRIRTRLAMNALIASVMGFMVGYGGLGIVFIEIYNLYISPQAPYRFFFFN